jgi:uncharacterized protein (UPF0335 family)
MVIDRSAKEQLKSFVERIENLEEQKKAIGGDITDLFAQAKGLGFNVKALKAILRLRKKDASERRDEEAILMVYMSALGMLSGEDEQQYQLLPRSDTEPLPAANGHLTAAA